jgi:hypothetical protein
MYSTKMQVVCAKNIKLHSEYQVTLAQKWQIVSKQCQGRPNRRYLTSPAEQEDTTSSRRRAMVCVMMRRSEMQVLFVKFWRCSPISVHAQGARTSIWPSFARKRARRPRPNTSACAQYICCAGRRKRAPLRSRTCLLRPQRTPSCVESPGEHEDEGLLPYV